MPNATRKKNNNRCIFADRYFLSSAQGVLQVTGASALLQSGGKLPHSKVAAAIPKGQS